MATYTYVPPTSTRRPKPNLPYGDPARPFPESLIEVTVGISVLKESGTWAQVENPTQTRLDAADDFFLGGHIHTGVSETTKTEIEGDGAGGTFTVE